MTLPELKKAAEDAGLECEKIADNHYRLKNGKGIIGGFRDSGFEGIGLYLTIYDTDKFPAILKILAGGNMSEPIVITVPAVPVAQPRPRVFNIGGKARAVSAPAKHPVNAFKSCCAVTWRNAYPGPPIEGAVALRLVFVMPRPKNRIWKSRPMPREPHSTRPDIDNLAKAVLDCLNQIAFRDDSQIHSLSLEKWIANGHEQPHVKITLTATN